MAANMYRVGDYVYFETSSTTPYQIRRIEELNKTPNGNVEAKVMCFYRRRDISSSLIQLADKHQGGREPIQSKEYAQSEDSSQGGDLEDEPIEEDGKDKDSLSEKQRHQLKHRELFLSRQVETLPATHIRGKCAVTLLNETESLLSYLNKEVGDAFFYSLVYDPQQKTLLADKGEIRVGQRYQAETTSFLPPGMSDGRENQKLEELVWNPEIPLSDRQIDQFLVIARSVGTFARALDCTSTVRQPSLHMSAAAASRDITLYHAMDILHKHNYDISKAIASLVPSSGPVLCRDEMEEWSASEANLFEEALDKYGKDFNDIRQDFLPWKSLKSIVEYYYMWKTTDRYVQQKRIKAAEAESKLKQVYIPNYNKPNPAQIAGKMNGVETGGRACESCYTSNSTQWYHWGPMHMQCRLCATCWVYWKKYGGLKMPTRLDGERPPPSQRPGEIIDDLLTYSSQESAERLPQIPQGPIRMQRCTISGCGKEFRIKAHLARHLATAHGLAIRAGSPRPVMKTRAAFCLVTTPLTRISRQVCADILQIRKAARQPIQPINIALIKQESQIRMPEMIKRIKPLTKRKPKSTEPVCQRLGVDITAPLIPLLERNGPPKQPKQLLWPKPELSKMVPLGYEPNARPEAMDQLSPGAPSIMKKRGYEQTNGIDGPTVKRSPVGVIRQAGSVRGPMMRGSVINQLNGRTFVKVGGSRGRKTMKSWMETPDDVYFVANDSTRKLRKQLTSNDFHRAARKPWRKLNIKLPFSEGESPVVVLD